MDTKRCKNGHDLLPDNIYIAPDGRSACKECVRMAKERWRRRNGIELRKRPIAKRFYEKFVVDWQTGCWNWTCSLNNNGYGRMSIHRQRVLAHRLSYELLRGPIPDGLDIDHLCRNRKCVNPAHLEPVTRRENLLRGKGPALAAKLTTNDVRIIRKLAAGGMTYQELADRFGVDQSNIGRVVTRRTWRRVK